MLKGRTPLIVALVLSAVAVLVAWRQIKMRELEVTKGWSLTRVMVAANDIQPGEFLSGENVAGREMPRRFIYDSVLVPTDMDVALGREVVVPVKRGEPLHWYQLRGIRGLERLSKAVRKRTRAVAVDVTDRTSVGHWVRPNDHVDLLGTFRNPATNQLEAVTLLQDIVVLATGGANSSGANTGRNAAGYSTVTVDVLPEEAEILVLAQELGTLSLSLRNPQDISTIDEEEKARTTMETLVTGQRVKKLRIIRSRLPRRLIEVIRGVGAKIPKGPPSR